MHHRLAPSQKSFLIVEHRGANILRTYPLTIGDKKLTHRAMQLLTECNERCVDDTGEVG